MVILLNLWGIQNNHYANDEYKTQLNSEMRCEKEKISKLSQNVNSSFRRLFHETLNNTDGGTPKPFPKWWMFYQLGVFMHVNFYF